MGYRARFTYQHQTDGTLKPAKAKGAVLAELKKTERQDVLILDDFGLQPFDAQARISLPDVIEDRHGKHSAIITSQIPMKQWHDRIGEKTIADAVLDR